MHTKPCCEAHFNIIVVVIIIINSTLRKYSTSTIIAVYSREYIIGNIMRLLIVIVKPTFLHTPNLRICRLIFFIYTYDGK